MHHLLNVFLEIVKLRKGPQALPASELLLGIVAGLGFLTCTMLLSLTLPVGTALLGAALDVGLLLVTVAAVLALRGFPNRFLQTATALAGSDLLLLLPTAPLQVWQHGADITLIVSLLLLGWDLVVAGHIFRHALDLPAWKGFGVAVGYFLISIALGGLFVGPGV